MIPATLTAVSPAALVADRKALVFDLDGTLLDTMEDIRRSTSDALVDCGCEALPPDYVMPNLHGAFPQALLSVMAERGLPDSVREPLIANFTRHYALRAHRSTRPYAGAVEFLRACRARGIRLGVCTNKRHGPALQALAQCGIGEFFEHVSGSDTVERPKPDPWPLLRACEALGAAPQETAYVGDTHVDALCAGRAGMPFLLFLGGYGSPELLRGQPVAASFAHYGELLAG